MLLGPPGSGKGTIAARLQQEFGLNHVSSGHLLRREVEKGSAVGQQAGRFLEKGELVPDRTVLKFMGEWMRSAPLEKGFMLDGFPRTVAQAAALDGIMSGRDPLIILDIVVPEAELVRRLSSRMICANCGTNASVVHGATCALCGGPLVQRSDDNDAVVIERLKVYHRQSEPLVEYYRVRPTFRSINGAQAPDKVAADLAAAIAAAGVTGAAAAAPIPAVRPRGQL